MTALNFISDLLHNHNIIDFKTCFLIANPTGFMIYLNWILLFLILLNGMKLQGFRLLAKNKHNLPKGAITEIIKESVNSMQCSQTLDCMLFTIQRKCVIVSIYISWTFWPSLV